MDAVIVLTIASGLVATLFGLLVMIVGWMGNKLYDKLDEMSRSMQIIEKDLHGKISGIDRRVTHLEIKCCDIMGHDKQ